ncbi:MAG: precorrin-6y C5,15-methyltransferase (decarboxylating) subunit CbiE [Magnetococcales bacterium]|nr:precorrin-6y C5,15-methyltransferase (decarboxylating) subunit CbiE [Magnetococcales bacterium]
MTLEPCWIIGVLDAGPDALTPEAARLLGQADLIIGETRFLERFSQCLPAGAEQRPAKGQHKALPGWIEEGRTTGKRVVVLATGDPLLSGLAGHLRHRLPEEALRVLPAPSTMQLAFARLKLPWSGARLLSVHAVDGGEWEWDAPSDHPFAPLLRLLEEADLIGLFTSPANSPARIARMLVASGYDREFLLSVAAALGTPEERVVADRNADWIAGETFAAPNVVILRRVADCPRPLPRVGLADGEFCHEGGLITKRAVRMMVLAELGLHGESVVWDVGAGSGSVGLEAARLARRGWVWAVERNGARAQQIRQNRQRLRVFNYSLTEGCAPEALAKWPDPDAVFIGGSGGQLSAIMTACQARLRPGGRLVLTLATLEHLAAVMDHLEASGWEWSVTQTQISHSRPIADQHRLVPDAPVWIVTITNPSKSNE